MGCALFFQVTMDDAFIMFRYGYNFVHFDVWNFFPSKTRLVEAYTTFLYTAISIIPAYLHIYAYTFYKILGFLLFLLLIFQLYYSTKNKRLALVAIFIFVANWQTYVHTFSGLETMLWCCLFFRLIILLQSEQIQQQQNQAWIIALLLPLTRPEGIFISIFAFLYLVFKRKIKVNYVILTLVILLGIAYFIWRYNYFGELFPLPFYQKSVKSSAGIISIIINSFSALHYIVCLLVFTVIFRKNAFFVYLSTLVLCLFYFVYGTSLLSMNFADRFSYQLFFPVLLFGIISISNVAETDKIKIKYCAYFLVCFVFAKGAYSTHSRNFSTIHDNMFSGYYYNKTHLNIAKQLRKLNQPNIKIFCNEAGIIPYYSNVTYYDPEGLADNYLSKHILTKEFIEKIQPDAFFYLIGVPYQEINAWTDKLNKHHPLYYYKYLLHSDKYEKIGYVECIDYQIYIGIAIRKDSKYYHELVQAGKAAIQSANEQEFNVKKFIKGNYYREFPTL